MLQKTNQSNGEKIMLLELTLNKESKEEQQETGGRILISKEQYLAFKKAWKDLANKKQLAATDMLIYNLILGRDEKNGFTPISNKNKLKYNCNNDMWYNFNLLKNSLRWKLAYHKNMLAQLNIDEEGKNKILKKLN